MTDDPGWTRLFKSSRSSPRLVLDRLQLLVRQLCALLVRQLVGGRLVLAVPVMLLVAAGEAAASRPAVAPMGESVRAPRVVGVAAAAVPLLQWEGVGADWTQRWWRRGKDAGQ